MAIVLKGKRGKRSPADVRSTGKEKKLPTLAARVFSALLALYAFQIGLFWLLQLALLNHGFSFVKKHMIRQEAEQIAAAVERTDFDKYLAGRANQLELSIRIVDREGNNLAASTFFAYNPIMLLTADEIATYFTEAERNGGTAFSSVRYDNVDWSRWADAVSAATRGRLGEDIRSGATTAADRQRPGYLLPGGLQSNTTSLFYLRRIIWKDGKPALLMLQSVITPVVTVKRVLRAQMFTISALLTIAFGFIAWHISRRISEPLKQVTSKAAHLVDGKFPIHFRGGRFREMKQLNETLNQAADDLQRSERLRQQLIANISHDLRTPLTMIVGYAEIMRDIPEENTNENLQAIIDETTRLTNLVNEMLELSKFQSRTLPLNREIYNLTEQAHELGERLEIISRFPIHVSGSTDYFISADRLKMSQVFNNLLQNAINFADPEDPQVHLTLQRLDDYVQVSIHDNGVGITPEDMQNIWNRYYKSQAGRNTQHRSGLGLSIVQQILELHEFRYGVDSEPGHGASFWFTIPIEEPPCAGNTHN